MRESRHTESDNAKESATLKVAHGTAAEAILVPQPVLTIEETFRFLTVETPLVLEPPDLGLPEHLR